MRELGGEPEVQVARGEDAAIALAAADEHDDIAQDGAQLAPVLGAPGAQGDLVFGAFGAFDYRA